MSIPTLCQACYKHYRSTVVNACPFCDDVQFLEAMLGDLVREGQGWYCRHGNVGDRLGDLHGRVQHVDVFGSRSLLPIGTDHNSTSPRTSFSLAPYPQSTNIPIRVPASIAQATSR